MPETLSLMIAMRPLNIWSMVTTGRPDWISSSTIGSAKSTEAITTPSTPR